jgi:hypothetical protein
MRPLALLFLTAVLIVSSFNNVSIAQVQDSSKIKTNLPEHTFYVYFINGYALAYKFYNSGNSDLRLRIDFLSSYSDTKVNRDNENNIPAPNKYIYENSNISSWNKITAEFAYSYNFYRSPLGQAYTGVGPFISYNRTKYEDSGKNTYPLETEYSHANSRLDYGFSIGLSAFIGLEAFLSKSIRVFAETQLTGGREWGKYEYYSESLQLPSSSSKETTVYAETKNSWFYNLTSVRLGLGISI